MQVSSLTVLCLAIAGVVFSHRIETVRAIFITITTLVTFTILGLVAIRILQNKSEKKVRHL